MITQNIFGFQNLVLNSLSERYLEIEKKVGVSLPQNEKRYSELFIRYIMSTGNLDVLKQSNKNNLILKFKEEIEKDILNYIKDYSEFSRELLILNIQNKYGLSEKEVNDYLISLKDEGKIKIEKGMVKLLTKN